MICVEFFVYVYIFSFKSWDLLSLAYSLQKEIVLRCKWGSFGERGQNGTQNRLSLLGTRNLFQRQDVT